MSKSAYGIPRLIFVTAVFAVIFIVDLFTPSGYAEYFLYVVPLMLLSGKISKFYIFTFAGIASLLILLGLALSRSTVISFEAAIANRCLAVIIMWVMAYLLWQLLLKDISLRKKEKELGEFAESASIGLHMLRPDGIIQWANRAELSMLGYNENEYVGQHISNFHSDKAVAKELLARISGSEELVNYEARLKAKDGSFREVLINCNSRSNGSGVSTLSCFTRDVTEQKKAELKLKESEARSVAIINSSHDCIVISDSERKIIEFNPWAQSVFRYDKQQVVGKDMIDIIIPPYLRKMYAVGMADYINSGEGPVVGEHIEMFMTASDGSKFPAELTITPSTIEEKVYFTAHIRDLTEIKRIEKSLIESRQKLEQAMQENRNIMDYSLDVICTIDGKGRFVRVSDACERVWGYRAAELEGKMYVDLVHLEDMEKTLSANEAIMAGRATLDFENRVIKKDGSMVNVMWSAYWLETSKTMFCVARDITERKRIELDMYRQNEYLYELQEQTQSLNDALEQRAEELISSNAELERFAYIASHDLQEPLRMVSSFLQLLQKKYNDELDEQAQKYIGFAVDASERMKRLILDLLEYSRVGSNKEPVTQVSLNKVLDEIMKVFSNTVTENRIKINIDPMPEIRGIESQIYQLFQNLLSNAIKYRNPEKSVISLHVKETNTHWLFSLQDNGIGMDKQYFNKIFIIFQRLHSKTEYSGTGIGLAICKKIVERHQGNIWVESEVGVGSTFYFTLLK